MGHRISHIGILFLVFVSCSISYVKAQSVLNSMPPSVELSVDNQNAYAQGVVLSLADQLSTSSKLSISLLGTVTLSVNATGPLENGTHTIPLSDLTVSVTEAKVGVNILSNKNNTPVTLSTNPQQLFSLQTTVGLSGTMYLSLQYKLNGGTGLLQNPGIYTTTLQFDLFVPLALGLETHYVGTVPLELRLSQGATLALTAAGSDAALCFMSAADYKKGITMLQEKALNVFSTAPYTVNVSASSNLQNGFFTIPIDNIHVKAIPDPPGTAINTAAVGLSFGSQLLINAAEPTIAQDYNLKYFTLPHNTAFLDRSEGTYSTTLTYTLTAP